MQNEKFSLSEFKTRIHEFCLEASQFGSCCSTRVQKEQQAENFHKSIWQIVTQNVPAQAVCKDGSVVGFTYKYSAAQFNAQNFETFYNFARDLQQYVPSVYISLFFKQLMEQQSLVFYLLSNKAYLKDVETRFIILNTLLETIQNPPCPLYQYSLSVLREMALYVGRLILAEKDSNTVGRILECILKRSAIDIAGCLFQPSITEVIKQQLLGKIFGNQSLNLSEDDCLKLLRQIPFSKLKANNVSIQDIENYILPPIMQALDQFSYQTHMKLLVYLSKIVAVIVEQYPSLLLSGLAALTRSKWPCKMIVVPTLMLYPWISVKESQSMSAFRELLNIYQDNKLLSPSEKEKHLNEYICNYLIPHQNIIQQVYSVDKKLAALNNNLKFPIIGILRKMAASYALHKQQIKNGDNLLGTIMETLFGFAYKSGSPNRDDLPHIAKLRLETYDEIIKLCKETSLAISYFIDQLMQNIGFLIQTQPKSIDGICKLITSFPINTWLLSDKDVNQIAIFLDCLVQGADTIPGVKDASIRFGKLLVEQIDWSVQSAAVCFQVLEIILRFAAIDQNWVLNILSGKIGFCLTKVDNIYEAEQFVSRICKLTDEMNVSLALLTALSIFEKKVQNLDNKKEQDNKIESTDDIVLMFDDNKNPFESAKYNNPFDSDSENRKEIQRIVQYEERFKLWQSVESQFKIIQNIRNLANTNGLFLPSILTKFIQSISRFEMADMKSYLSAITPVVLRHLSRPGMVEQLLDRFHTNVNDPSYTKYLFVWTAMLLNTLDNSVGLNFLNCLIREEFKAKRSLEPILSALKRKDYKQQVILSFITAKYIWVAYAFTLCYDPQIPPLEERPDIDSGDLTELRSTEQLNTQIESSLWIAAECAIRLIKMKMIPMSLLFWNIFFELYFKLEEEYGDVSVFPQYLRDRYAKSFSAAAREYESSNRGLADLFYSLTKWDKVFIPGDGNFLTAQADILIPLILESERSYSQSKLQQSTALPPIPKTATPVPQQLAPVQQTHHQPHQQIHQTHQHQQAHHQQHQQAHQQSLSQLSQQSEVTQVISGQPQNINVSQPNIMKPLPQATSQQLPPPPKIPAPKPVVVELPKSARDAIDEPVVIPETIFERDVARFNECMKNYLIPLKSSEEQSENLQQSDNEFLNKLLTMILDNIEKYMKLLKEWEQEDEQYAGFTKKIYANIPAKSSVTLCSSLGNPVPVTFPVTQVQFGENDIIQKITENRERFHQIQKKLHECADRLAVSAFAFNHITQILISSKSSSAQTQAEQLYFPLLTAFMDMEFGKKAHLIWRFFAEKLNELGLKYIFNNPSRQLRVLDCILKAPALPPELKVKANLNDIKYTAPQPQVHQHLQPHIQSAPKSLPPIPPQAMRRPPQQMQHLPAQRVHQWRPHPMQNQMTQQPLQPVPQQQKLNTQQYIQPIPYVLPSEQISKMQKDPKWTLDRSILFVVFNPSSLLEDHRIDYIQAMNAIATSESLVLAQHELDELCSRFNLPDLFDYLEQYPEGKRFTPRDEIKLLINAMKHSLCREDLVKFGRAILKNCIKLAFPAEISSFLRLILTICKNNEYKSSDWHELMLVESELLATVKPELALNWINIVRNFMPLPENALISATKFVESIVLETSLGSYLQRCKINSQPVDDVIQFFGACLYREKDEIVKVSNSTFTLLLNVLTKVIKEVPILIDRLWALYCNILQPYTLSTTVEDRVLLGRFMRNLNWESATFHENPNSIEELWLRLIYDPETICHLFQALSWEFIAEKNTSSLALAKMLKLYVDISVLAPVLIPNFLKQRILTDDAYADETEYIWMNIKADDFAKTFSGNTLSRLVVSCNLAVDPSVQLCKNAILFSEIALRTNNAIIATACAQEIRGLLFLVVKGNKQPSAPVWCLSPKDHGNLLMNALLPIMQKYPSKQLISIVFSCLRDMELGVLPKTVPYDIAFANCKQCPFDATFKNAEAHQEMLTKIKGIIIHFCAGLNETLAVQLLRTLPILDLPAGSLCEVLEEILHTFMTKTTSIRPRDAAAAELILGQNYAPFTQNYNMLLKKCVETRSAVLLTVLLHQLLLGVTMSQDQTQESILNAYLFAFDYILQFIPHPTRDFDILYLYFLAAEIIDSNYWPLHIQQVNERTNRFIDTVSYLGSKNSKESWIFKKTQPKFQVSNELQNLKISPTLTLACKATEIFLHHILNVKRSNVSTTIQHDTGGRLLNYGAEKDTRMEALLKLKTAKFYKEFPEFFNAVTALSPQFIDHQLFRDVVHTLYPLVPYLKSV